MALACLILILNPTQSPTHTYNHSHNHSHNHKERIENKEETILSQCWTYQLRLRVHGLLFPNYLPI